MNRFPFHIIIATYGKRGIKMEMPGDGCLYVSQPIGQVDLLVMDEADIRRTRRTEICRTPYTVVIRLSAIEEVEDG